MKKFNVSFVMEAPSIAAALGQLAYPAGDESETVYDDVMVSEVKDA